MASEQIRTQVLLLHSQQYILDTLSAGFDDRYSVHQATSGSEALSTLSETPIHIIVCAQDLPGMSGIEALREAKKRAPDLIGILLTSDDDGGDIESFVGEKEVFQIVRGSIAPEDLYGIVDSAAQQMRMKTISKSANDNEMRSAALADTISRLEAGTAKDTGEHIVMETMENGSSLISDNSGRMLALNAEDMNDRTDDSENRVDVLVLSKDTSFLDTLKASAKGLHAVHHAVTPDEAEELLVKHPIGVLVTDAAIAGNHVAVLMQKLRSRAPRLVGIVAGRRDDGESLMELINRGYIYRFLLKPLSPGRARLAVEASVKYHQDASDAAFSPRDEVTPLPSSSDSSPVTPTLSNVEPMIDSQSVSVKADSRLEADVGQQSLSGTYAAIKVDARPVPAEEPKSRFSPALLGASAALVAVLGGAMWWLLGTSDDGMAPTTVVDETTTIAEPVAAPTQSAYATFLDNARFARDTGRVLSPPGDNAIEWYLEARRASPNNVIVRDELAALVDQVIGTAETAVLENRRADAQVALDKIALVDPGNPRLAFINAQLNQALLHDTLDDARTAIRDARYQDASRLLSTAINIPGANFEVIDQLTEDLATARSAQRIDDVLAFADERISTGQLTTPANDNARYFFELALNIEPDNTAARQGLLVVAGKLVLSARAAIDNGDLAAAAAYLDSARDLDPDNPDIQATEAALEKSLALQPESSEAATAAIETAASADDIDAPVAAAQTPNVTPSNQDAGDKPAGNQLTASPVNVDNVDTRAIPAQANEDIVVANVPPASSEPEPSDATADSGIVESSFSEAGTAPAADGLDVNAKERDNVSEPDLKTASGNAGTRPDASEAESVSAEPARIELVSVSELNRTKYVAPRYPRSAHRRSITGWVDVRFIVAANGNVINVEVINSAPSETFDEAATQAVSKWRFEPIIENGQAVAKRAAVRISFNLE